MIDDENSIAAKHRHDYDPPSDGELRRQLAEMEAERDEARADRDRFEERVADLVEWLKNACQYQRYAHPGEQRFTEAEALIARIVDVGEPGAGK